jgi:EpsI family protein
VPQPLNTALGPAADAWTPGRSVGVRVALSTLLLAFIPTWVTFPAIWTSYFSHGFVVAAFTVWVLWSRRALFATPIAPTAATLLPVLALSILWMIAYAANVQVVHQTLLPLIAAFWALSLFGTHLASAIAGFTTLFLLAVPVWMLLVPILQGLTVFATGLLLQVLRLDADIQGNLITIPEGTFEVAGSCAGQAFLMAGISIAAMYLYLIPVSRQAGIRLVIWAAALSLLANWLRVVGLIVIGHVTAMQHPLIRDHGTYGWVIFSVSLLGFFAAAPSIERRWPLHRRATETGASSATGEVISPTVGNPTAAPSVRRIVLATAAGVCGPALWLALSLLPRENAPLEAPGVSASRRWAARGILTEQVAPLKTGDGTAQVSDSLWRPRYLGAQEQRRDVWHGAVTDVQIDRLLYPTQSQGRELVGDQNRIDEDSLVLVDRIVGPIDGAGRLVRQTVVRTGEVRRVMWYWFRVNGHDVASPFKAKLLEPLAFLRRGPPAELVVVSSRCAERSCDAALAAVAEVVSGTAVSAPRPPAR